MRSANMPHKRVHPDTREGVHPHEAIDILTQEAGGRSLTDLEKAKLTADR